MISTSIELLGFAALVAAAALLGGEGWGFLAAGVVLPLVGVAVGGGPVDGEASRALAAVRRRRREARPVSRGPHPPLDAELAAYMEAKRSEIGGDQ